MHAGDRPTDQARHDTESERLTQEWERYFELFRLAPVASALITLHGIVREINEAGCRLLGVPAAQVIGHPFIGYVARESRKPYLEHLRHLRSGGGMVEAEIAIVNDDQTRLLHLATRRSAVPDRARCWMVMTDVSEQRRLEDERELIENQRRQAEQEQIEATARSEAKDRFLATLSHELRTPLTPALFAVALLAKVHEMPPRAAELLTIIQRNIELEARLIDDLLDLTRITRDKVQLDRARLDINDILGESLQVCAPDVEAKGIDLQFDARASRRHVDGDPTKLRQVFWNLLNNAVKFTPPGGRVTVSTLNDIAGRIHVRVSDSGIGIDPAVIPSLFTPFEQVPNRRNRGLGLGLAICRGFVEAHGGRIFATSPGLGLGATFEVELATLPEPAATGPTPPPVERAALRILVVEDHRDSAEMLKALLATQGYHVDIAGSVSQALFRAQEGWDVIISDLGLPDGSGLEIGRRFRDAQPAPRIMIALSGYGSRTDIEASRRAGFDLHMVKPVEVQRILDRLRPLKG